MSLETAEPSFRTTSEIAYRGSFREHDQDRSRFHYEFQRLIEKEPGLNGRVLDIGCGPDLAPPMKLMRERMTNLDGVEPSADVHQHPQLINRWQATLEESDVPENAYDLAYAYNVAEHVPVADPFFAKVFKVLKPGGVFWALTPHGRHPFTKLVRLSQQLKLKEKAAARDEAVNHYPAYYRLNTASAVSRSARKAGFASARFVYLPCVQWDMYFPRVLRFVPHVYDRMFGLNFRRSMLLLAYRLQRPND